MFLWGTTTNGLVGDTAGFRNLWRDRPHLLCCYTSPDFCSCTLLYKQCSCVERGKAHTARTQGCWTQPFPGVYRCCPLLNDAQVGRSSVTGQGGSHTPWGSFVAIWVACLWAESLSCVWLLCWLIWSEILLRCLVEKFWDSLRWKSIQNLSCEISTSGIWSQIKL